MSDERSKRWFLTAAWPDMASDPRTRLAELRSELERLRRSPAADAVVIAIARVDLGVQLRSAGLLDEARTEQADARAILSSWLGEEHARTLGATDSLGITLLAGGELHESVELLRGVYDVLGDAPERRAERGVAAANLSLALRVSGDIERAVTLQYEAVTTFQEVFGSWHVATLTAENNLGAALRAARRHADAQELLRRGVTEWPRHVGEEHPLVLAARTNLAALYREVGEIESSRNLLVEILEHVRRRLGSSHLDTVAVMADLAKTLDASGRPAERREAVELARTVLVARERQLGAAHPQTLHAMRFLARAVGDVDHEYALRLGEAAAARSAETLGRRHYDTIRAFDELAELRKAGQAPTEASVRGYRSDPATLENLAGALTGWGPVDGDLAQRPLEMALAARPPSKQAPDGSGAASDLRDLEHVSPPGFLVRTAHVALEHEGSEEIAVGARFGVRVHVDCAARSDDPYEASLILPTEGEEDLELEVWLVASRHFEIEQPAVRTLRVDPQAESSEAIGFVVVATAPRSEFPEDPEVRALFSYRGWPSGEIAVPVPLAQGAVLRS